MGLILCSLAVEIVLTALAVEGWGPAKEMDQLTMALISQSNGGKAMIPG